MADSLKASPAGLNRIDQARRSKRWHKTAEAWCAAAFTSRATLNRFWGGKPIRRETFVAICDAVNVDWQTVAVVDKVLERDRPATLSSPHAPTSQPIPPAHIDWGDAPDTAGFVGREAELQTLASWLNDDGCRLIVVLGMGGIGKTALSLYAARSQAEAFDCVLWRSLRNAPAAETVIQDCIAALLPEAVSQLPTHMDGLVNWLLKALRTRRCLLMLDNMESVLQEGSRTGCYRSGYEGYGHLLRSLSETRHPSQVLITSRELPRGITAREGRDLPVRCLRLPGLAASQSQAIFHHKGTFSGTAADWEALTARYAGNPLALKIVASAIRDFFAGDLAQFLRVVQQEALILDDIRDLIARQFERLPALEQAVMRWLAIRREPVTLADLQTDWLDPPPMRSLLQAIATLQQRSLIEKPGDTFTQQPVVMEAVISDLVDGVVQELGGAAGDEGRSLLHDYALSQATAQDYVRNSQIHLIIQPILQQLGPAPLSESLLKAQLADRQAASGNDGFSPSYAPGNLLTLLQTLQADLTGSDFSGLPIYQVNLQNYPLHQTHFERCEFRRTVFTENLGNVLAAVFSPVSDPSQQSLATCDTDCTVRLWDALSGKLLRIFAGHTNWVRAVAFSPDGAVLASAGADQTLRLWDVASGACLRICQGHENEIFAVAFSPNGKWLVTGSSDRTLRLWDSFSGDCLHVYGGHESGVRTVAFCPASITLVSGSDDGTVRVWDVSSGQSLCTMQAHAGGVRAVAIAPNPTVDALLLASGGGDPPIKLWDGYTGKLLQTLPGHSDTVYAIAFAPSHDAAHPWQLASGSGDGTIRLWQRDTGQCLKTLVGPQNQVSAIAIAPTGDSLAAVSLDQTVRLWHLPSGQITRTWTSHTDWVFPVAFSPDGASLVSGSNDGSVRVWSVSQHTCRQTLLGHCDQVCALAVCPENHLIASASRDETIRLWDLQTGQCRCILRGHRDWVYSVAFSPTLQAPSGLPLLASGGADGQIRLWDCQTGECLHVLSGHQGQVWDVAFAQTGWLASGGADHTARIWDVDTATCLQVLTGHDNRVYSVAFPPVDPTTGESTDAMLLTSSSDQTIKAWEWRSRTCLRTYHQHTNWVFDIACAPDGTTFASASHDQTLRIWDAITHTCRHCCIGHDHLVSSVAYSPDGCLIASGSQDQSVRLWDSRTGDCTAVLRAPRLYEGMNLAHSTGLTAAQLETLSALGAVTQPCSKTSEPLDEARRL